MAKRTQAVKKGPVNIHDAKTHLSRLIERAESGEEIVIARAGKPVVRLVALEPKKKIKFGLMKSEKLWIADDFDAPLPEDIQAYFEGCGE
jgi:prevent-host-death family protein